MQPKDIVIWAHSECRSTMSLYREVKRRAGVSVIVALWKYGEGDDVRRARESTGQRAGEYGDLDFVPVGEDIVRGRELLSRCGGSEAVHVFCVYQVSGVWRRLIVEAKESGARVVVYAEAPCEMCLGPKALLKRLYYRFALPFMVHNAAQVADGFISQSGRFGIERLVRLGWRKDKIVPFGYASAVTGGFTVRDYVDINTRHLRVLHTGVETPYRGVETLGNAEKILNRRGIKLDIVRTHGTLALWEMDRLYRWADVFVACGLCEPWGMRVNDAVHAGVPVVMSSGMGAKMIVEQYGCGSVYAKGSSRELADTLERFARDAAFRNRAAARVAVAHEAWLPEVKAKEFLGLISG